MSFHDLRNDKRPTKSDSSFSLFFQSLILLLFITWLPKRKTFMVIFDSGIDEQPPVVHGYNFTWNSLRSNSENNENHCQILHVVFLSVNQKMTPQNCVLKQMMLTIELAKKAMVILEEI